MSTFELIASKEDTGEPEPPEHEGLGSAILLHNVRWFTKVRWIVVAIFIVTGLVGALMPGTIRSLGLVPPTRWPWILAGALAFANIFFCAFASELREDSPRRAVEGNIWFQIVADLMVVTVLVHIVGSIDTFIAFTYLFHIVLACIFFPPRRSLLVILLAAGFYFLCVALELSGIWPVHSFFANAPRVPWQGKGLALTFAGSAVLVWCVVWFFVSILSEDVRERDRQLRMANEQLIRADQEQNIQVLRTTHDLKAPFSGIESNIQVLRTEHWQKIPEDVRRIIERIQVRAQTLSERIKDILALGDLRSRATQEESLAPIDLHSVLNAVIEDLDEKAKDHRITICLKVPSITVDGNMKQLIILFSNLVANAIFYSHEAGKVEISAKQDAKETSVFVTDYGIGIKDEALPHIFDEYFRTKEGARFNKLSTGLGLTIVRTIVQTLGLRILVTSEWGKGTMFKVIIPKKEELTRKGN